MRSIERTLLAWILGALTLGVLVVVLITYLVTLEKMHEVFDADLKNVAQAVASYHRASHGSGSTDAILPLPRNDTPGEYGIVTVTWTPQGLRVFSSDPRVLLPFTNAEGLSRPSVQGESWIVYSSVGTEGVAQAAQRVSARQEMAGQSAAKVFPALIGLVVAVGGLLVFGLRRGLQPLGGAAQDLAQRSAQWLEPITLQEIPKEVKPLVLSINDLMSRLAVAFATQKRFVADAAHELRTPVTALRLQLQWLERAEGDAARTQAIADLGAGIARSQRLVEQLLHVARTDPDGEPLCLQPVDLAERVRSVVAALSMKADRCGIDLGATCPPLPARVMVEGDAEQLTVLLNNLVENALRYTPEGGVVDVGAARAEGGTSLLRVTDTGPGIPEADRQRVFERFHRGADATALARDGSGSGLGLAIVRAIADRHGAVVTLHTPASGQGLDVQVRFLTAPVRSAGHGLTPMDDVAELEVTHAAKATVAPVPRSHAAWFVGVGGAATFVHWGVAVTLVEYAAARPLMANIAGWVTAVCVSFAGHHRLSFRGHGAPAVLSAWRFLLVSAAGFAVNQFAYAVLLSVTSQSYAVLLGAVLASVAAATYIASRCWVFRRRPMG